MAKEKSKVAVIRTILVYLWAALIIVGALPYLAYENHRKKKGDLVSVLKDMDHLVSWFAGSIVDLCGSKVTVVGAENLPPEDQAVVYVANHQSNFDIPVAVKYIPQTKVFVVKEELKKIPFFDCWIRGIGCIYIARGDGRKALESILAQTMGELEVLLIDDGSPDGSGALCDQIAGEDSRVRVFHKENGGVSSARNLGMAQARGTYLSFVDADDWLPADALETLYRALREAGADTAGGAHNRVETDGRQEKEPGALPAGVYGPEEIRRGIVDRLLGERMGKPGEVLNGFVWRFLFSREIIQGHNMAFAGAYLEDELFLLEYFCYARKLAMVDQPVYQYLQNPVSVTRRYLPDYMQTFQGFMKAKEDLAQRMGLGENMPLWRENSYWSGLLIAIGNEFAASNAASLAEKRRRIRGICQLPAMARAIQAIQPQGLGRNKQIVADLVRRRRFFLLSLLYGMKNRG